MSPKQTTSRSNAEVDHATTRTKCLGSDNEWKVYQVESDSESEFNLPRHTQRRPRVGLRGGRYRSYTLADKLAARSIPQPNGCILVQGHPNRSGHVTLSMGSVRAGTLFRIKAHIFAWQQKHKRHVPAGRVVMHRCDQPRCVNPAHLRLGSQRDNIADSVRKGRFTAWHQTGVRLTGERAKRQPQTIAAKTQHRTGTVDASHLTVDISQPVGHTLRARQSR
jgi:hypothetical protein